MADKKSRPGSSGRGLPKKETKPFPLRQLLILALCRFSEPVAFCSIFPYVTNFVESLNIAENEQAVSIYAGALISAFALAEFAAAAFWGRISDKIGRKPVLLTGLFGTGLSMLIFGFSRNFPLAVVARVLGGLLNGNIGVIQTTVAEIVPDKAQQPRAYTFMPLTWCLGAVIGNFLGGALSDPITKYPDVFHPGGILETYPFLLPNLVATVQCVISVVVGILFLEESHATKKYERDRGLELGSWLWQKLNFVGAWKRRQQRREMESSDEASALLSGHQSSYNSGTATPQIGVSSTAAGCPVSRAHDEETTSDGPKMSWKDAFTKQVILVVIAYGLLALHTVVFDLLLPVTLSMSPSHQPTHLPFKLSGGFGYSSTLIGAILSLQAVFNMFYQLLIAPPLIRKFGSLKMFRFMSTFYCIQYIAMPYLVLLPEKARLPALAVLLIWKVAFGSLAYLSITLLIANSAPSLLVLGLINGVAASAASLARGIGPTMFGAIHSAGLKSGYGTLAWWVAGCVAILSAIESYFIQEPEDLDTIANDNDDDEQNPDREEQIRSLIRRASMDIPEAAAGGMTLADNEAYDDIITRTNSRSERDGGGKQPAR